MSRSGLGVSAEKLKKFAKKANMALEALIEEIRNRLNKVGVLLRCVEIGKGGEKKLMYFAVMDPSLEVPSGWIDSTSAAILAIIYLRARDGEVSMRKIFDELARLVGEETADRFVKKAIPMLKKRRLIEYDEERGTIRVTPLARAMLPSEKELDKIIIEVLTK